MYFTQPREHFSVSIDEERVQRPKVRRFDRSRTLDYREWLDSPKNKDGFVLNMGGEKIHYAWCPSLQRDRLTDPWEKACCLEIRALEEWLLKQKGSKREGVGTVPPSDAVGCVKYINRLIRLTW